MSEEALSLRTPTKPCGVGVVLLSFPHAPNRKTLPAIHTLEEENHHSGEGEHP